MDEGKEMSSLFFFFFLFLGWLIYGLDKQVLALC